MTDAGAVVRQLGNSRIRSTSPSLTASIQGLTSTSTSSSFAPPQNLFVGAFAPPSPSPFYSCPGEYPFTRLRAFLACPELEGFFYADTSYFLIADKKIRTGEDNNYYIV